MLPPASPSRSCSRKPREPTASEPARGPHRPRRRRDPLPRPPRPGLARPAGPGAGALPRGPRTSSRGPPTSASPPRSGSTGDDRPDARGLVSATCAGSATPGGPTSRSSSTASGMSYAGDRDWAHRSSYPGGRGRDAELFLHPNETSAARDRAAYPDARVEVVGCPKLDTLPAREPGPGPVIAVAFHWDGAMPELRWAWPRFRHAHRAPGCPLHRHRPRAPAGDGRPRALVSAGGHRGRARLRRRLPSRGPARLRQLSRRLRVRLDRPSGRLSRALPLPPWRPPWPALLGRDPRARLPGPGRASPTPSR